MSEVKAQPGTYDHTEEHTKVYSAMGIDATDSPIDRAWARLEDLGYTLGPAVTTVIELSESIQVQYFLYARALYNHNAINVNQTVLFTDFSGKQVRESGL